MPPFQRGLFGKKASAQAILCAKAFGEVVVSGAASGHLYVWEGRNCIRAVKAHSGAITALHVIGKIDDGTGEVSASGPSTGGLEKPGGLCTGSTDGKIQLWSAELEVGACFDLASLGGVSKTVQSVNWDFANHKILIGSWSAECVSGPWMNCLIPTVPSAGTSPIAATSDPSIFSVVPAYSSFSALAGTATVPALRAATSAGQQLCGDSKAPTAKPPTSGLR